MTAKANPRGTIAGGYVNRGGDQVWIVAWAKGPAGEVKSANPFEPGQAVELTHDGVLVRLRHRAR